MPARRRRRARGSAELAREVPPGQRLLVRHDLRGRAGGDDVAAELPGARAEVDHVIGGPDRLLVVLDDQDRVAEVAEPRACRGGAGCPAGGARSTARRGCRARRPGSIRSASPGGSAAPRHPDSVPAARSSVRYSRPTFWRKPSRSRISFRTRRAIACSRSPSASASKNAPASLIVSGAHLGGWPARPPHGEALGPEPAAAAGGARPLGHEALDLEPGVLGAWSPCSAARDRRARRRSRRPRRCP